MQLTGTVIVTVKDPLGIPIPNATTTTDNHLKVAKGIRDKGFNGKLVWLLTSLWPDGVGTTDTEVQRAEFNIVAPYVDVIIATHYSNLLIYPYRPPLNPPRLIEYYDSYIKNIPCPASECDFTIT